MDDFKKLNRWLLKHQKKSGKVDDIFVALNAYNNTGCRVLRDGSFKIDFKGSIYIYKPDTGRWKPVGNKNNTWYRSKDWRGFLKSIHNYNEKWGNK